MRKVLTVLFLILLCAGCAKGEETVEGMDAVSSLLILYDGASEIGIDVVVNRKTVEDEEACAWEIIEKFIEDDFHTIKFCWEERDYPVRLTADVYADKQSQMESEKLFSFEYAAEDFNTTSNMKDNPEDFCLKIR